jgi:hypothetical protein
MRWGYFLGQNKGRKRERYKESDGKGGERNKEKGKGCFGGTCGLHLQCQKIIQERNQHEASRTCLACRLPLLLMVKRERGSV